MDGQLYNSKHSFVKKNHFLISLEKDFDRCIKNKNAPSEKIFNSWCIAPSHTKFSWASQGCGLTFSNLLCVHRANTPTLVYLPGPQLQRLIKVILVKSCGEIFLQVFFIELFSLLSRSAHQTANFMNPEYFVCGRENDFLLLSYRRLRKLDHVFSLDTEQKYWTVTVQYWKK